MDEEKKLRSSICTHITSNARLTMCAESSMSKRVLRILTMPISTRAWTIRQKNGHPAAECDDDCSKSKVTDAASKAAREKKTEVAHTADI